MVDTKLSNESDSAALTGAELLYVVQGGAPFKTTTGLVAALGGAGLTLVSTLTANNTADNLSWTGLTEHDYLLIVRGLQPTTNGVDIMLQFGTGGTPTWITAGYYWVWNYIVQGGPTGLQDSASAAGIFIGNGVDNANGGILSCSLKMFSLQMAIKHTVDFMSHRLNGGTIAQLNGGGNAGTNTTAKTAARLITSSGNLNSGSASLYRFST